jgi:hypothetical protein
MECLLFVLRVGSAKYGNWGYVFGLTSAWHIHWDIDTQSQNIFRL